MTPVSSLTPLAAQPGVHSARYAQRPGLSRAPPSPTKDDLNNECLLSHASASGTGLQRRARYRCVIAAARDGKSSPCGRRLA